MKKKIPETYRMVKAPEKLDEFVSNVMDECKELGYRFQSECISENALDLIVIIGANARIEHVNRKPLLSTFGYKKGEIVGKEARMFIHPDDLEDGRFPTLKYLSPGEIPR